MTAATAAVIPIIVRMILLLAVLCLLLLLLLRLLLLPVLCLLLALILVYSGGAALYFSDCPSLPEEMEPAPPHGALPYTLEPEGVFTACYEPPAMEG